ncbi:MAG TPA: hypothetical protein VLL48_07530 [Longimicrobiales bacterium]|nr:hypothetical protein [Longimicrobiales bacterium]
MRTPGPRGFVAGALAALLAAGCGDGPAVLPRNAPPASFETGDTLPTALQGIPVEPVQGRTGPGARTFYVALRTTGGTEHLYRAIGKETFNLGLRLRAPDLAQYPCVSCHSSEEVTVGGARDTAQVHHDIKPAHPRETGADCSTCHSQTDVARLRLEPEGTASLDHAYRLCARCHQPQVTWWANGAHGKRLVAWRGRRVVTSCTDCHDPHQPAAERRVPYPGPEIPRTRGRRP